MECFSVFFKIRPLGKWRCHLSRLSCCLEKNCYHRRKKLRPSIVAIVTLNTPFPAWQPPPRWPSSAPAFLHSEGPFPPSEGLFPPSDATFRRPMPLFRRSMPLFSLISSHFSARPFLTIGTVATHNRERPYSAIHKSWRMTIMTNDSVIFLPRRSPRSLRLNYPFTLTKQPF